MGTVWLARDTRLDRRVALKLLPPDLSHDERAVARFRREAQALAKLSHPGIVQVHDADEDGGRLFLVMEYVEGEDLSRFVRRAGPLAPAEAAKCVRQAALALQHAHERGLIHRDIKPSNLLRTPDGTVKVLDLGLARFLRDRAAETVVQPAGGQHPDAGRTGTGVYLGTPAYAAPEQFHDASRADARTDVYSLGCTLYFLLSGRPPFVHRSVAELAQAHATDEPEPIETLRLDVPEPLVAVLRRMMAKAADDRFPNAAAVASALLPFVAPLALPPDRVSQTEPPASVVHFPWRRRRGLRWGAGLAALATVALLVFLLRPPRPGAGPGEASPGTPGEPVAREIQLMGNRGPGGTSDPHAPEPTRFPLVQLDRVEVPDVLGWPGKVLVLDGEPDGRGGTTFGTASNALVVLRGRLQFANAADAQLAEKNLALRAYVNAIQQLPVELEPPANSESNVRRFTAVLVLSRERNDIEVRLCEPSGKEPLSGPNGPRRGRVDHKGPPGKVRLHVLIVGVGARDLETLKKQVLGKFGVPADRMPRGFRTDFQLPAFEMAVLHNVLGVDVDAESIRGELLEMDRFIRERRKGDKDEAANDVVLLYYQGSVASLDGRRYLHTTLSLAYPDDPRVLISRAIDTIDLPTLRGCVFLLSVDALPEKPRGTK
jgi:hypothetical protein